MNKKIDILKKYNGKYALSSFQNIEDEVIIKMINNSLAVNFKKDSTPFLATLVQLFDNGRLVLKQEYKSNKKEFEEQCICDFLYCGINDEVKTKIEKELTFVNYVENICANILQGKGLTKKETIQMQNVAKNRIKELTGEQKCQDQK